MYDFLKYEDLLLFFVVYNSELRIWGFRTVGGTKDAV